MIKSLTLAALVAVGSAFHGQAAAENSTKAGAYTIHYSAFTADTLSPEIASAYGLQRSKNRGLLNVSVIKEAAGTTGTSTTATVEVDIVALTGQKSPIPMRELKDKGAVYYIGEFPVYNQQKIDFEIQVKPQGDSETHLVKMSQEFFTD